jgi:hypothetical protein
MRRSGSSQSARPLQLYNAIKLISQVAIRTLISIGWLFMSWQEFPLLLFLAVVFLPLHIDANHDVGVMFILCNGQWPIMSLAY